VEFPLEPERRGEWAGRLPDLRVAFSNVLAKMVRAALLVKSEPTPSQPEGEINFTGAMGFINGKTMTSPKARDLMKRLFRFARADTDIEKQVDMDPLVRQHLLAARKKRGG